METKQSSIEWLMKQFYKIVKLETSQFGKINNAIDKAKEMHKQEIIDAYQNGGIDGQTFALTRRINFENGEQYYNETFVGKDII
jgi:hypothetical protein